MASGAFLGRAFIHAAGVAICAGDTQMRSGEGKCCQGVVKGSVLPAFRSVALGAVLTELTSVGVVCLVAREAVLGCAFKHAIHVAGFTGYIRVRT